MDTAMKKQSVQLTTAQMPAGNAMTVEAMILAAAGAVWLVEAMAALVHSAMVQIQSLVVMMHQLQMQIVLAVDTIAAASLQTEVD